MVTNAGKIQRTVPASDLREQRYITPYRLALLGLILVSLGCGLLLNLANPTIVLGLLGTGILATLLFYQPYFGALGYVVFEYARLSAMFPALQALQIGKLIVIPTLVIWFVFHVVVRRKAKVVNDRIYLLFISWFLIASISAFMAIDSSLAYSRVIDLGKWLVTSFLIMNLLTSMRKWQIFTWLYLLLNFKLSQFQIRSFIYGMGSVSNQARYIHAGVGGGSSFFGNATDFGLAMVVVIPFAFYLTRSVKSKYLKVLAAIMTSAFAISILRSGSRGAALALFVMAILYWLKSGKKLVGLGLVVLFIAGFWSIAPDAWRDRFVAAKDYEEDSTASSRIELWKGGLRMIRDHPLTGVGLGNFPTAYGHKYRSPDMVYGATAPHNIYIQATSELGIGGLVVVLGVIVLLLRRNAQTRRMYRDAGLDERWIWHFSHALDVSLIGYAVGGFFLTVLYYPHLFMIIALTISLHHIARDKVNAKLKVSSEI